MSGATIVVEHASKNTNSSGLLRTGYSQMLPNLISQGTLFLLQSHPDPV
jgi:hypothetical protein